MKGDLIRITSVLLFLCYLSHSKVVFGETDIFYTQHCNIGFQTAGIRTFTCLTKSIQKDIIKTGLTIAEYSKPAPKIIRYQLYSTYSADPTSSFTINIDYDNPYGGINMGIFLIVIKKQLTSKFIDLVNFDFNTAPQVDNNGAYVKSAYRSFDVTTATIFTGGTTGLKAIPFASFMAIVTPGWDPQDIIQFELFASLPNPNVVVQIRVQPLNRVQQFGGFVLLYNPLQIPIELSKGFKMNVFDTTYLINSVTQSLDLTRIATNYGPGFGGKCFIGFYRFRWKGEHEFEYKTTWSSFNNYTMYTETKGSLAEQQGAVFCFGNNSECSEDVTHKDLIDTNVCYTASTCPLPVFTGWTVAGICPSCIQLACQTCQVTDRSSCSLCKSGTNTHLSGTTCVCDTNFIPVTQAIDTASSGLWNNLTPSLVSCKLNCSAVIAGCLQNDCTNSSFCTVCDTASNYVLVTISPSQQTCKLCNVQITHCTTCTDQNFCADCDDGYYLNNVLSGGTTVGKNCPSCSASMPYCIKCTIPTSCLQCEHFVSGLISGKCFHCSLIQNCQHCLVNPVPQLQCTLCIPGYYIISNQQTSKKQCRSCKYVTNYCNTCSDNQTCTSCRSPYQLGSSGICDRCIPGYELASGFCLNYPGCIGATMKKKTQVCIACSSQLNFVYNFTTMACECAEGFQQFYQVQKLMQCLPKCGDGITVLNYEHCDDNNTFNGDGCNSECQVQDNFQCTISKPSKCTLILNIEQFVFNYALRIPFQNKAKLSFSIWPASLAFGKLNWKKLLIFQFSPSNSVYSDDLSFSYDKQTNELFIEFPYYIQLENTILHTTMSLDLSIIISKKTSFFLTSFLAGRNSPLIIESQFLLQAGKRISLVTLILIMLSTLQFIIGSYSHKMIGLQTIQIIQLIYFSRMIISPISNPLLQSINVLEYTATGYHNFQLFFTDNSLMQKIVQQSYIQTPKEFLAVQLKKYFFMNVNVCLLIVPVILIAYGYYLMKKLRLRNMYLSVQDQSLIDQYTKSNRNCLWFYDHAVFNSVFFFSMITFFFIILSCTSLSPTHQQQTSLIQSSSFICHIVLIFMTVGIYCNQIFLSYQNYFIQRMTPKQRQKIPKSMIQKLQNDKNNPDRPNYHSLYVLVYLVYYLTVQTFLIVDVLFPNLSLKLQILLSITFIYLIILIWYRPYHRKTSHNYFLVFNQLTVTIFLAVCLLCSSKTFSFEIQMTFMGVILLLMYLVVIGGFVRIFVEKKFRKILQKDSSMFENMAQNENLLKSEDELDQNKINKRQILLAKNKYIYQHQLDKLGQEFRLKDNQFFDLQQIHERDQQFYLNQLRKQYYETCAKQNLIQSIISSTVKQKYPNQEQKQVDFRTKKKVSKQINRISLLSEIDQIKHRLRTEFQIVFQ